MIDGAYVQRMARYNRWQNENLYGVAGKLSDGERRRERGAFFGSIHKTLSHLLWADRIQMSRFTDVPRPSAGIPESVSLYPDWQALKDERLARRRSHLLFRCREARTDEAALGAGGSHVQPPDPSSRSGPLHADPGWRPTVRHRSAVHAGVITANVRHRAA
jgi:DinB family